MPEEFRKTVQPLGLRAALAVAEKALRDRLRADDDECHLYRFDDDDMPWEERLRVIRDTDDVMHYDGTWDANPHVTPYRRVWRALQAAGVEPLD